MSKPKIDKKSKIFSFYNEKRKLNSSQKLFIGSTLIVISFVLLISFTSYFFSGNSDQSTLIQFTNKDVNPENWMSKVGAFLADLFLHKGFGISSYIICFLFIIYQRHIGSMQLHFRFHLISSQRLSKSRYRHFRQHN